MATRTTLTSSFAASATARLTATITEEDGTTGFKPTTLTLHLLNAEDGAVINSRNGGSILDENGGTVSSLGALVLLLAPADMAIVGARSGKTEEVHIARLTWTWSSGTKTGWHEIAIPVTSQL